MEGVANVDDTAVVVRAGDASDEFCQAANDIGLIAVDTETSGLDWRLADLNLVQLYVPGVGVEVVRVNRDRRPAKIADLLGGPTIKVFHHAMFDLRFMVRSWGFRPQAVECTKVAAKLLWPADPDRQSLKSLCRELLGRDLDKSSQLSDWSSEQLSDDQIAYAARDVLVLPDLHAEIRAMLDQMGLARLARDCWAHIPTRVELELGGFPDPFAY